MHRSQLALLSALLAAFLAGLPFGCSKKGAAGEDKTVSVEKGDPEMDAAIAKARASLPEFWRVFEHPERGESKFALKVRITDKNGAEHFWVTDLERSDGQIHGTINNEPETVQSVKLGERIRIPEADISDWLYMRDGKMVGNYTLRALFKHMSPEEIREAKERLADP